MRKKALLFSFILIAPVTSFAGTVVVGQYSTPWSGFNVEKPFIQVHETGSKRLDLTEVPGLPEVMYRVLFEDLTCSGPNCIAVGSYHLNGDEHPMLLTSHDSGHSWGVPDYIDGVYTRVKNLYGSLEKITCQGNVCITGGLIIDDNSRTQQEIPFISSQDGGVSWSAIRLSPGNTGEVTGLACIGQSCLASIKARQAYLIMNSQDAGKTWSLNKVDTSLSIKSIMTAKNNFIITAESKDSQPVILLGTNQGKTVEINHNVHLPSNMQSGHISTAACHGAVCIAAGHNIHQDNEETDRTDSPLLLISQDSGSSWNYVADISDFPQSFRYFSLNFSACNEDACTTGGSPALILTVNLHHTPYVLKTVSRELDVHTQLIGISCIATGCTIAGQLDGTDIDQAQLFSSDRSLENWKIVNQVDPFKAQTVRVQKVTGV